MSQRGRFLPQRRCIREKSSFVTREPIGSGKKEKTLNLLPGGGMEVVQQSSRKERSKNEIGGGRKRPARETIFERKTGIAKLGGKAKS